MTDRPILTVEQVAAVLDSHECAGNDAAITAALTALIAPLVAAAVAGAYRDAAKRAEIMAGLCPHPEDHAACDYFGCFDIARLAQEIESRTPADALRAAEIARLEARIAEAEYLENYLRTVNEYSRERQLSDLYTHLCSLRTQLDAVRRGP